MSVHFLASSAIREELIKRSTATTASKMITYNAISRKSQRSTSCGLVLPLFLAQKYAFLSLGMRRKQWHANSVYQPVAGVQIVGTAQKDVSRKNSEWLASFLPFFHPRSLTSRRIPLSERLDFLQPFPPVISNNITCCLFRICNEKT